MKIKVLLSSVLSIVLCLTMIAGATYALFTDSETVNIAVTAGKVDIDVTVDKIQTLSYPATDWDDDLKFTNGGLVNYTKDATTNELTLDKITPGDAVKVNMNVVNNSDVKIKYRVKVGVTSGLKLFKALDVSIGGVAADYKGMTFVSDWVELDPIAGEDKTFADIALEIKLPYLSESQNDLMGESTTLYYTVQAVQGNASAEDLDAVEDGTTYIYNAIDLELFAENVKNGNTYKGETVQLMSDVDLAGIEWTPVSGFQGTFDGKKTALTSSATDTLAATTSTESTETTAVDTYTIKNLTVKGNSSVGFFATISGGALVQNVTFEKANVTGNHWVGVVFGWEGSENVINTVKNVHIVNSAVTCMPEQKSDGTWDNGDKAGAIGGYAVSTNIEGCTVESTTIEAYRDLGGILGYANGPLTVVSGCSVGTDVVLSVNNTQNYKNYSALTDYDANNYVGEIGKGGTVDGNEGVASAYLNGVKYTEEDGEVILEDAAAFTGSEFVIPEGVTVVDLKAFQKLANLKKVTFPSTLETVVNAAFIQSGLESVTIPGNVTLQERLDGKSLANTFASCMSLTSVTLEDGITSLPSGCFQECYALESVTIPASVTSLAKKAFYDCLSLKTVYLLSEDCTIGAQAFGSNQTGKFSNMTIYVVNEEMKAAVEATLTDNNKSVVTVEILGDVVTPDDNATAEENKTALENAIADALANAAAGEDVTVYVSEGNYKFPAASSFTEGVTLICAEGTVFEGNSKLNINGAAVVGATFSNPTGTAADQTINGTFKDCTFYGSNGLRWCYAGETVLFENCVFDGSTYGVHFDGGANEAKFVNCTLSGFNATASALKKLIMEGCTFKSNGRSGYNGINLWGDTEMTNCTFVFDGSASTEWVDLCGSNKTATFTNCVVTDGTTEKDIATVIGDYGTNNIIIIDGAYYVSSNTTLATAVANTNAGGTVYLRPGNYELKGNQKDGITIAGFGEGVKLSNLTNYAGNGNLGAIWQNVNFENVIFTEKVYTMEGGTYSTFKNCTFEKGVRGAYARDVKFEGCTFYANSEGFAMHFGEVYDKLTVIDCTFVNGSVAMGDDGAGKVTFTGCTFSGETTRTDGYFTAWVNCELTDCTFEQATELWVYKMETSVGTGYHTIALNNTTDATVVEK